MRDHYEQQGLEMPAEFFPPDLPDGAELYVEGLNRLIADRPLSLGFGERRYSRIPFTSIDRYAARLGLDADEFAMFDRIICAVDTADVARLNEQLNKRSD